MLQTNNVLAILALGICTTFACAHNDAAHADECMDVYNKIQDQLAPLRAEYKSKGIEIPNAEYNERTKPFYINGEKACVATKVCEWKVWPGVTNNWGSCTKKVPD